MTVAPGKTGDRSAGEGPVIADLALFGTGLVALALGADWLVTGSSRLAESLGVSPLVTGLTVVAFATSSPELVVSVGAAARGQGGLALGNVMGSTVANVGLILGLCALLDPVAVHRRLLAAEAPLVALVLGAVLALSADAGLGRLDGLLLVAAFTLYVVLLVRWALGSEVRREADLPDGPAALAPHELLSAAGESEAEGGDADGGAPPGVNRVLETGRAAVGLAALLVGARWLVDAATALAAALGVPEAVVGATLVAVGTSLPELASSVAAAARGLGDVAVGNVVGSNVFNLSLVLGAAALAGPIRVEPSTLWQQLVPALAFSLLLLPLAYTRRTLSRVEGGAMLAAYAGYVVWLL